MAALRIGDSAKTLPPEVRDRSVWYGAELAKRDEWIKRLSDAEIDEVRRAVEQVEAKGSNVELVSLTATDCPLPTLGPRLQNLL
ncbi:MAG TPA: hypothetical protein VIK76_01065, partial [Pyrinomonadaceae bacterium]